MSLFGGAFLNDGYHPDRDPDIILLRITQRRAELARWQVIARRWWAALVGASGLFTTVVLLGLDDYIQVIAGVVVVVTAAYQGCWHQGMTKGFELRCEISEAERELLAAEHRIEVERERRAHREAEAELERAQSEPEQAEPICTTQLVVPGPADIYTEIVTARAVWTRAP